MQSPLKAAMEQGNMSKLAGIEQAIPSLRRYAWSLLRNGSEADDLVQDTLVRALDRVDTRTGEGDLRAWLFAIMHNLHVSRWRHLRRRAAVSVEDAATDVAIPPSQPARAEVEDALRGLDQLSEEHRQVLLLVVVEGLDYAEVARVLDLPIGTVMSRLSRARNRLRDFMEGRARPVLRRVK